MRPASKVNTQKKTYAQTVGGLKGHLFRRSIHIFSLIVPLIYYRFIIPQLLVITILIAILLFEVIRLKFNLSVFGQRQYEKKQISSFAWSAFSLVTVLLLAPGPQYGIPLIWSWSLGDPLMGELRYYQWSKGSIFLISALIIGIIWILCWYFLGTSLIFVFILPPLIVFLEWLRYWWLDDSVLMLLVPLMIILLFHYVL